MQGGIHDSRGVARALTGNYAGAVEDFTVFIAWARAEKKFEDVIPQREAWIAELRAGRNPIDAVMLVQLRSA